MEGVYSIADAINNVLADVRQKFKDANAQESILQSLQAFAAAVDWKEPWIIGVVSFQAVFFLLAILTRHKPMASGCIFATAAFIVYMAEYINTYLAKNWKAFARQPYFDQQGIFFSAVVSAPLLFVMFILVVNYLIDASSLLIKMKRKELQHNARKRARQEGSDTSGRERKNKKTA